MTLTTVQRIHVVLNPASGQPQPVLRTLNGVFHPAGIEWDVSMTRVSGDASRFAKEAVARGADLVAAYGGDGTQMEVAQGLRGSDIPMAILPGGTANLLSVELGIPKDLAEAARLMISDNRTIRSVDMGHVLIGKSGEYEFILRVGIGFEGKKIEIADREMKDKYGEFAYTIGGAKALHESQVARYRIVLDGKEVEVEGINLLVTNAGTIGVKGLTRSQEISVSDGLLDVLVATSKGLRTLTRALGGMVGSAPSSDARPLWHAREIEVEADPPQPVNGDGELWGDTPIKIRVIPAAVQVIVPA